MPNSVKLTKEMEELSHLLDKMNSGECPTSTDKETADLLFVAALLKKADLSVDPPPHILEQTLEKVVATLPPSPHRSNKKWLYSGALGTAASILLIFGLHLIPSWSEVPYVAPPSTIIMPPSTTESPIVTQQPVPPQALPNEHRAVPTIITPPPTVEEKIPAQTKIETVTPPTSPTSDKAPPKVEEKSAQVHQSKSAYRMEASALAEETPSPLPSPLLLPGKLPDSTIIDEKSHTVRQVFYKDTPQQITITQRLLTKENNSDNSQLLTRTMPIQKVEMAATINKITITIYDQEVILEGSISEQELLTIGKSLSP